MIDVEVFSKAGIGKNNEDYVLHSEITPGVTLIVVCDGMGGLSHGADASRIVAHNIETYMRKSFCSLKPEHTIVNAIFYANDELAKDCLRLQSKMGASVGLTLFVGSHCYYSWLGDVRVIMQTALVCNATTILIAHNHPSGNTYPSGQDDNITRKVKSACELMNIRLLDHIIVTPNDSYFSYCDEGRL